MVTRKGLRKPIAGKYKGELAEPIYLSRLRTLASLGKTDEQQVDELVDHFNTTRTAKFGLLFQHYRIDPASGDAWHHLATLLAFDHVPGMNYAVGEKPRAGRKRSWQSGLGFELIREVEAEQKLGSQPVAFALAIKRLQRNNLQKWGRYTLANLITRHREARRRYERIRPIVEALMKPTPSKTPSQTLGGLFGWGAALVERTDEK